ncbi:MAG: GDP-mannose 4,6-dehydratase [Anaerolineae bacterium]
MPCISVGNDQRAKGAATLRVLITGIGGFAGSHLAEHLLDAGAEVSGTLSPRGSIENLGAIEQRCHLLRLDLIDYPSVQRVLDESAPEAIFHLAARASVPAAWSDPAASLQNNVIAQLNVLRALTDAGAAPRILIVASADEYGRVRPEDLPVDEDTPLRPVNPYAVSKVTQDYMGLQYFLSHHLPIVRVRPFNHAGPRQETGFVVSDFASQIAAIEQGLQAPVLRVGDLSAERDFSDVRDVVRAYDLALRLGEPGEVYNIGSSRAVPVSDVLDDLLSMSRAVITVTRDAGRMRPSDIPRIVSDCTRLHAATGWSPELPLERTLADTLDYWRTRTPD